MATYTSSTSGLWSAGSTWVGGVKPPSAAGHKIVISSGHTVTYDEAAGEYGDDTSGTVEAGNGIVVNGTLRFSRDVSTQLTCRGTLMVATNGTFDCGRSADRIPDGITTTIVVNYSLSPAPGKHALTSCNNAGGQSWYIRGQVRTRNTTLTGAVSAGASVLPVADSVGWKVGDELVIASDNNDPARCQVVTISGGSAPNWTVTPNVTIARAAGCRVGNFTSNVVIRAHAPTAAAAVGFACGPTFAFTAFDVGDVRFQNCGVSTGWLNLQSRPLYYGVGLSAGSTPFLCALERVAVYNNINPSASQMLASDALSAIPTQFNDCAMYSQNSQSLGLYFGNVTTPIANNCVMYRGVIGVTSGYSAGAVPGILNNCVLYASVSAVAQAASKLIINGGEFRALAQLLNYTAGDLIIEGASLAASRMFLHTVNATGSIKIARCDLSSVLLSTTNVAGSAPSKGLFAQIDTVNGNADDSRVMGYWQVAATDSTVRRRGSYSVKIAPQVANATAPYIFTIPGIAGVAQMIKGSLRFDATYGTATPPRIDLSGQGVTASFVAPAAADTWHDFTLTFTPTTTGDITVTVTVQSASTAGFAWLDGVWHYPMIQSVRHFGFQWLPQAAQVVDPRITLTEAAALAQPVVEDHVAQTITVSGPVTARQVFEACIADLCQTANLGRAVHISSATGDTFSTTYTVALAGAGAITGVYVDATGTQVLITAPALVSGSRVQLYNVTDAVEMFNGVLSGTGLSLPATWTANKTVRLRVEHPDKLPLQTLGVLTSTGLSFLDVQADDTVYMGNGIDGSTCIEFSADGANIQVDINDPDGVTSVQRLYAWMQWYQTTSAGIASSFFGALTAIDSATYLIDHALANIRLDNVSTMPVRVIGGYLARRDGSTIIAAASNSIQMDPGKAYVAPLNALSIPAGERLVTLQPSGAMVARG